MKKETQVQLDVFLDIYTNKQKNDRIVVVEGISGSGKTSYINNKYTSPGNVVIPEFKLYYGKPSIERQSNMLKINLGYEKLCDSLVVNPLVKRVIFDRNFFSTLAYAYAINEKMPVLLLKQLLNYEFKYQATYVYMKRDISSAMKSKKDPDILSEKIWHNETKLERIVEFYDYVFSKKSGLCVKVVNIN